MKASAGGDDEKITLRFLADGIERVNLAFVENSQLSRDDYPPMVVQYLMSALLIALGQPANAFGLYRNPDEVGYTGWLSIGDETLFFAPTEAVILKGAAGDEGGLSPFGDIS